jgi:hypothetical protein
LSLRCSETEGRQRRPYLLSHALVRSELLRPSLSNRAHASGVTNLVRTAMWPVCLPLSEQAAQPWRL